MHDFLQLRMKIEMGTRVVSVSTTEFALAEKTEEERMLSSKRRHSQLDVDSDDQDDACLLYTSPSPRDLGQSRMPSSA